jgi:cobalt-zinc-cadmium efflux system outer membrane protein
MVFRVGTNLALVATLLVPQAAVGQDGALTLEEALRIARDRFPSLAAAKSEVAAAKARVRGQRAFPNPRFGSKYEAGNAGDREYAFELSQELEIFGQSLLRKRKAEWELAGKEQDFRRAAIDLTLEVKTAFFDLSAAETVADVARENLSVADRLLKASRKRFEAGGAPRADWIKAEVEYTKAIQEVLRAERSVGEKRAALNFFLGRDLGAPLTLAEPPLPGLDPDLRRLGERAVQLRPEAKAAEAALRAAESQVSLARAKWFPSLSIFFEAGRAYAEKDPAWHYVAGPRVSIPIFDYGSIRGEIQQAQAGVEAARASLDLVRQRMAREAQEAHLRAQEAGRQLESFQTGILGQADQLLKLTLQGYEQGALTLLDVLEAQRSFRVTKTDHALAVRNYRQALAQLDRVIGFSAEGD